ncbi:helix-turn-helix domain-containing protein [Aquimarina sp. MMG016]|uniref:AraC family transcriptional regulator n=1 Tax=Aquimarina sp. MMG016 TaxID=2822690 RepID=UPI001B3A5338|nr:helix-turn-helix domain-containing protein [Aquimarina sp. MMG016]MBQ4822106.1 AraC family transcriptional regulator [Aquimarina sp. MMG016]
MIINILITFGTCQAFFIAYILLKSERTLFKKLFATLLIIEGITLFERLLVETELINSIPHILGISHPISFLKPPLMLFMALAITIQHYRLSKKSYLHFIVFILMLFLNLPFYFLSGAEKLETVAGFMSKIPSYQSFEFYFILSFFAYIGVYIFFSIKKLQQFKNQVTNNVLVNWYYTVLMGYSAFLVLHLIYFTIQPIGQYNFALVNQISMLIMTFIIQSVAYKLIDKSVIFNSKPPNLDDLEKRRKDEKLIINKFETDKIYLDDNLSLKTFSKSVLLPPAYVSEIINQKFNCSFKKLVNQYRLNEAKKIVQKNKDSKLKLIDIAFESGFNNKVSFYRAFKEFEGISPSEYLEKIRNS